MNKASIKLKKLCLNILDLIEDNGNLEQNLIYKKFAHLPSPIVSLAINLIFKENLVVSNSDSTLSLNENILPDILEAVADSLEYRIKYTESNGYGKIEILEVFDA